jgi:hypothetical protein
MRSCAKLLEALEKTIKKARKAYFKSIPHLRRHAAGDQVSGKRRTSQNSPYFPMKKGGLRRPFETNRNRVYSE